jgi:hypothetical protein
MSFPIKPMPEVILSGEFWEDWGQPTDEPRKLTEQALMIMILYRLEQLLRVYE